MSVGTKMKVFGDMKSGNCQKVAFTADYLGLDYEWVDIDILAQESHTPEFLALNPSGQVPVIQLADGRTLAQSNAIIRYLARGSALLPDDAYAQAKVDEALFWEQYSHEPYVAVCRFQMLYLKKSAAERESWRVERADAALDHMDAHLAMQQWYAGEALSIADIALVAYTRLAAEGGLDVVSRANLARWIGDCEVALSLSSGKLA